MLLGKPAKQLAKKPKTKQDYAVKRKKPQPTRMCTVLPSESKTPSADYLNLNVLNELYDLHLGLFVGEDPWGASQSKLPSSKLSSDSCIRWLFFMMYWNVCRIWNVSLAQIMRSTLSSIKTHVYTFSVHFTCVSSEYLFYTMIHCLSDCNICTLLEWHTAVKLAQRKKPFKHSERQQLSLLSEMHHEICNFAF